MKSLYPYYICIVKLNNISYWVRKINPNPYVYKPIQKNG
jgi:hypothetical protein